MTITAGEFTSHSAGSAFAEQTLAGSADARRNARCLTAWQKSSQPCA